MIQLLTVETALTVVDIHSYHVMFVAALENVFSYLISKKIMYSLIIEYMTLSGNIYL